MNGVVDFCRAREVCQEAIRATQEERTEATEANRALMSMLTESMQRHNVRCIEVQDNVYVKMTTPTPTRKPIKTTGEVEELISGIGGAVLPCSKGEIPAKVTEFVSSRLKMKSDTRDSPRPRVSVVTRAAASSVPVTTTPSEVRTLTGQFVESCSHRKTLRMKMRPLQKAQQESERAALQSFSEPVRLRMRKNNVDVDMRVVKCERKKKPPSRALGVRLILKMCYDAAVRVTEAGDGDFEANFRAEVMDMVRGHFNQEDKSRPEWYLRVYRTTGTRMASSAP